MPPSQQQHAGGRRIRRVPAASIMPFYPNVRAAAYALPRGDGDHLTTLQLLQVCLIDSQDREYYAKDVFSNRGAIFTKYNYLCTLPDAALFKIGIDLNTLRSIIPWSVDNRPNNENPEQVHLERVAAERELTKEGRQYNRQFTGQGTQLAILDNSANKGIGLRGPAGHAVARDHGLAVAMGYESIDLSPVILETSQHEHAQDLTDEPADKNVAPAACEDARPYSQLPVDPLFATLEQPDDHSHIEVKGFCRCKFCNGDIDHTSRDSNLLERLYPSLPLEARNYALELLRPPSN